MKNKDRSPRERWQCPCGSGLAGEKQFDGHGIPLPTTCDKCHQAMLARYRPDISRLYDCDEPLEAD